MGKPSREEVTYVDVFMHRKTFDGAKAQHLGALVKQDGRVTFVRSARAPCLRCLNAPVSAAFVESLCRILEGHRSLEVPASVRPYVSWAYYAVSERVSDDAKETVEEYLATLMAGKSMCDHPPVTSRDEEKARADLLEARCRELEAERDLAASRWPDPDAAPANPTT